MKRVLLISTREGAGKTSLIVALAQKFNKKSGYMKPFGDRLIYKHKINWDYDAELIKALWKLDIETQETTLGFHHSKLRYIYTADSIKESLNELIQKAGSEKDILFIEGGKHLTYGASIFLDSMSLAQNLDCEPVVLISGDENTLLDDITFLEICLKANRVRIKGVIFNKVPDVEDFETVHLKSIQDKGIPVLGVLPFKPQLTYFSMQYLADRMMAKVIAGEAGLSKTAKNIFVGAMSTEESLRSPLFNKENKLLITSGDRSDMILAALDSDTVGILLTNNILPPTNLLSKASERNIPLLLLNQDTYQVARQIDQMDALLTVTSKDKFDLLNQLVDKYLDVDKILK